MVWGILMGITTIYCFGCCAQAGSTSFRNLMCVCGACLTVVYDRCENKQVVAPLVEDIWANMCTAPPHVNASATLCCGTYPLAHSPAPTPSSIASLIVVLSNSTTTRGYIGVHTISVCQQVPIKTVCEG
mmetsp:Transcript_56913/g.101567  ORF Transcript_56913/g.101567 Transcript_56913/m.101567 type:complete len:129 (+) Transcript_56913:283-669(+)